MLDTTNTIAMTRLPAFRIMRVCKTLLLCSDISVEAGVRTAMSEQITDTRVQTSSSP